MQYISDSRMSHHMWKLVTVLHQKAPVTAGVTAPEQTHRQLQIRSGLCGALSHSTQPGGIKT